MNNIKNFSINQLKNMSISQLNDFANEIRQFLINLSNEKEIHLSSNLSIIEITISLFLNFDFTKSKVIYDTGHQTYIHKIITGRVNDLINLKTTKSKGGLMEINATIYDHYSPGHSGNSLSVISGMYNSNDNNFYVCVIGDSALNTGLSFEGLNYIADKKLKIIIILNDNQMSISKCCGALCKHLNKINKKNNFFTNLGFSYIGVIDGHNIVKINKALKKAKKNVKNGPVIVHLKTIKGKGLKQAEEDKIGFYHTPRLDSSKKFGDISFINLNKKIKNDSNLRIINPAMNFGTGFYLMMKNKNYFDPGICESHALSFASGLALENKKVFIIFYSTFLQRAYDQIIHDVARMEINLTILLDRCDLALNEGKSHHGIFDIGFLKSIPNIEIYAPRNFMQLNNLIDFCYKNNDKKINVIRYPTKPFLPIEGIDNKINKIKDYEILIENNNSNLIITFGPYTNVIYNKIINENYNIDLINFIKINNVCEKNSKKLNLVFLKYKNIFIYERIYGNNGLSEEIIRFCQKNKIDINIYCFNYKNFPNVGTLNSVDKEMKMDLNYLFNEINKN